jgi:hypothetical protein
MNREMEKTQITHGEESQILYTDTPHSSEKFPHLKLQLCILTSFPRRKSLVQKVKCGSNFRVNDQAKAESSDQGKYGSCKS